MVSYQTYKSDRPSVNQKSTKNTISPIKFGTVRNYEDINFLFFEKVVIKLK